MRSRVRLQVPGARRRHVAAAGILLRRPDQKSASSPPARRPATESHPAAFRTAGLGNRDRRPDDRGEQNRGIRPNHRPRATHRKNSRSRKHPIAYRPGTRAPMTTTALSNELAAVNPARIAPRTLRRITLSFFRGVASHLQLHGNFETTAEGDLVEHFFRPAEVKLPHSRAISEASHGTKAQNPGSSRQSTRQEICKGARPCEKYQGHVAQRACGRATGQGAWPNCQRPRAILATNAMDGNGSEARFVACGKSASEGTAAKLRSYCHGHDLWCNASRRTTSVQTAFRQPEATGSLGSSDRRWGDSCNSDATRPMLQRTRRRSLRKNRRSCGGCICFASHDTARQLPDS